MRDYARWVMHSRLRQFLAMLGFAVFALPVSAAIAVAGTLASGAAVMLPLAAGVVGSLVFISTVVSGGGAQASMPFNAIVFIVSIGLGILLARTRSLNFAVQLCVIAMLTGMILMPLLVGDLVTFWRPVAIEAMDMLNRTGAAVGQMTPADQALLIERVAQLATAFVAAPLCYGAMIALVLGHYLWHAGTEQDDSYGRFRDLNIGRTLAVVMLVVAALSTVLPNVLLGNLAMALLLVFGLQGVAIVHWLAANRGWKSVSLFIFYGLLLVPTPFQPVMVGLLCVAGYVDAWFNLVRANPAGAAP